MVIFQDCSSQSRQYVDNWRPARERSERFRLCKSDKSEAQLMKTRLAQLSFDNQQYTEYFLRACKVAETLCSTAIATDGLEHDRRATTTVTKWRLYTWLLANEWIV